MQIDPHSIGIAINALTYGATFLVYQFQLNVFHECVLSIHEEYINIMHILIGNRLSYLLKLHEVNQISNQDYSVENKIQQLNINYYIVLQTDSIYPLIFGFKTQSERDIIQQGLRFFINEAIVFYQQLSEYNPFKAELMMLFLAADDDGGNLLDIEETITILTNLNIKKTRLEIQEDILQVNKILYELQNIKKPKNFQKDQLTPLSFEYILKYYSSKLLIGKIFHNYCPMFRNKLRDNKNSIVDVVQADTKSIMSPIQLKIFYEKELNQIFTEEQCVNIIQKFPVYDGQGKEKNQQSKLISFNNVCSLLFSKKNNIVKIQQQSMKYPLIDYHILTDFRSSSLKTDKNSQKHEYYESVLRKGSRCIKICLEDNINGAIPIVIVPGIAKKMPLEDVLRIIESQGFRINPYPIILYFEINCSSVQAQACVQLIQNILSNRLYILPEGYETMEDLPSLEQLKYKVLIMSHGNFKHLKHHSKENLTESLSFYKLVSIVITKLDFQRKNHTCWNACTVSPNQIITYEQFEEQNICDYAKKTLLLVESNDGQCFDPQPMLRIGAQLIALNYEIQSPQTHYLSSKFNERSYGYILKPQWILTHNLKTQYAKNFDQPKQILEIQVLCAQNIVIVPNTEKQFKISVSLKGNQAQEKTNKVYISQKQDQGYYAQINLSAQFNIFCVQMATVCIYVLNNKKNIVASRCVSYAAIREGMRAVQLLNHRMQMVRNSYLLVRCKKKIVEKKNYNLIDFHK